MLTSDKAYSRPSGVGNTTPPIFDVTLSYEPIRRARRDGRYITLRS